MAEKDSNQPSKDVKEKAKNSEKAAELKNPFEEGTKSYLVAKALIDGEVDRSKVARELKVSLNTIYNITGQLGRMGYPLAIHGKKRKVEYSTTATAPATATVTHATHGEGSESGSESGSEINLTQNQSGSGGGASDKNRTQSGNQSTRSGNTGRTYSEDEVRLEIQRAIAGLQSGKGSSQSGSDTTQSGKIPPQSGSNVAPVDLKETIRSTLQELLGQAPDGVQKLPGTAVPFEDVEIIGEKVNYKVALNPEVF